MALSLSTSLCKGKRWLSQTLTQLNAKLCYESAVRVKGPGEVVFGRRPPLQTAQGWGTREVPWRKRDARGAVCQRGLRPGARIGFVDAEKFATYSDAHF